MTNNNSSAIFCLDPWAYLAGLIEADGHIQYKRLKNNRFNVVIVISGHVNQTQHFLWLANMIGVAFTFERGLHSSTARLVWANPRSVEYIQRRLSLFMAYVNNQQGLSELVTKLDKFILKLHNPKIHHNYIQRRQACVETLAPNNDILRNLACKSKSVFNIIKISVIVGFIDGDGEAHIQIGAKHLNSTSKNNISAVIRVSQKSRTPLDAMVKLLHTIDSDVFNTMSVYNTTSGGYMLHFTAPQSATFINYMLPTSFKNPWTSLGAELVNIIHEFKQHYNFSVMRSHIQNKPYSEQLIYWAKQRTYLISLLQLIRIIIRSPSSRAVKGLQQRLDNIAAFLAQHKQLQHKQRLVISSTTNRQLLRKLEKTPFVHGHTLLSNNFLCLLKHIFISNAISIPDKDVKQLQNHTLNYLIRALGILTSVTKLNHHVALQIETENIQTKTITLTYYPNIHFGQQSLRFKPWAKLIKVYIGKRVWYTTKQLYNSHCASHCAV